MKIVNKEKLTKKSVTSEGKIATKDKYTSRPIPLPVSCEKGYKSYTTWLAMSVPASEDWLKLGHGTYFLDFWLESREKYKPKKIIKLPDDAVNELYVGDVIVYRSGKRLSYGIIAKFSKLGIPAVYRNYSDLGTTAYPYSVRTRFGFIRVNVDPKLIKWGTIKPI